MPMEDLTTRCAKDTESIGCGGVVNCGRVAVLAGGGWAVLLLLAVVTALATGFAPPVPRPKSPANPPPKGYVCFRADRPIQVDGKLDDRGLGEGRLDG